MPLSPPVPPFTADDATIERALADAELPALLAAVAHLTGDRSVLRPELRPDPARLREPQAGYTAEQQALARRVCLDGLRRFRDERAGVPAPLGAADMVALMSFSTGSDVPERYVPLLREELALEGDALRAPRWQAAEVAPGRTLTVAVIGAGMSGLAAAHRLDQAGIAFTVLEKNDDVGGTWLENRYPGCRVDVQNHMYSYSFAQKHDWPEYHSTQPVLQAYFRECAEQFGLLDRIRFGTEVRSCTWDDDTQTWTLAVRDADGDGTVVADAVVCAVGQLNRPKFPDLPGVGSFAGPAFHSAQWDDTVELTGRRVAVIGTGASACQFIPEVAEIAGHLDVYQRTAPWLIPSPRYHQPVAAGFQWLLGHVPAYAQWYRFWLFWRGAEGMLPAAYVDPSYPPTERAVSARNEEMRQQLQAWIDLQAGDDAELRAALTPNYPPLSKRFVLDDGIWAGTLRRPTVSLHTQRIAAIEPDGIRTADGELHPADVLIYGTGFQASRFLTPMTVTGRDGIDLHEQWAGDARAFLGVMVPNFPNFFCLYGPNTNIVANGSIIYFSECEVHFLVECLHLLLAKSLGSLDPRREAHDAYNDRIDEANRLRTWGFSSVSSWYKNDYGRSAQNWPFAVIEFWEQTRAPDPADYVLR
ncbi:MAG: FAD-dependent oxidoreductase [Acidimicrobiales bacterium]